MSEVKVLYKSPAACCLIRIEEKGVWVAVVRWCSTTVPAAGVGGMSSLIIKIGR